MAWALMNLASIGTVLAGIAALAAFGYTVWQDRRWLRIEFEPHHWAYSPVDQAGTKFRVGFFIGVRALNPGKTPNRITSVKTWRDSEEVPNTLRMFQSVEIAPFEQAKLDVQVTTFESIEDPQRAYQDISMIEIEVRALRGYRRMVFEPAAFRTVQ